METKKTALLMFQDSLASKSTLFLTTLNVFRVCCSLFLFYLTISPKVKSTSDETEKLISKFYQVSPEFGPSQET